MDKIVWAKVKSNNSFGAVLKADGHKVFVDSKEQHGNMITGDEYLLLILETDEDGKVFGTERIEEHVVEEVEEGLYKKNQKITGYIYQQTPLGYKVVFDEKYSGIVYQNEIFGDLEIGQKIDMFVKQVREDGRIDLSLQRIGYRQSAEDAFVVILHKLNEHDGFLKLTDKSSPEEIKKILGMSKKKFKKTIGTLYKQKKIGLEEGGIRRV